MPKLLLIRHCQSTGRHPDAPLSEAGAKAAGALITRLHDLAPDAVYSSPYERAHASSALRDLGWLVGWAR
jgi:broad specificity phosphatase PhoE